LETRWSAKLHTGHAQEVVFVPQFPLVPQRPRALFADIRRQVRQMVLVMTFLVSRRAG
jgi:hypothetical protein